MIRRKTTRARAPATFNLPADVSFDPVVPGIEMGTVVGDRASGAHGTFVRFQPGATLPMHLYTEALNGVVIDGILAHQLSLDDGGERAELTSGSHFSFDARQVHSTACVGEEPCLFFVFQNAPFALEMAEAS